MVLLSVKKRLTFCIRCLKILVVMLGDEILSSPENTMLDLTLIGFWMGLLLVLVTESKF